MTFQCSLKPAALASSCRLKNPLLTCYNIFVKRFFSESSNPKLGASNASAKTKYPGRLNLLKTLQREEQFRLDTDGRSSLFKIGSPNYCPSGSLLRVFYYSLPLPSGVSFPLTPIKFNQDVHHLWDENGKLPFASASQVTLNLENNTLLYSNPPSSFWGMLIATHRNSVDSTFLLRNIVDEVSVEISFQLFSPLIVGIQVLRRARQGRSRIYWMRERPLTWIYKKDFPTEAELNSTNPFYKMLDQKEEFKPFNSNNKK